MASPQRENGYTAIANELLEAICKYPFPEKSSSPLKVMLFIIRKTYGYQKKADALSLTQIEQGTGLARSTIVRSLKWLVAHLLLVAGKKTKKGRVYGINKDYSQWLVAVVKLVALPLPVASSSSETHKRNNKRNNTSLSVTSNKKLMYEEPTITLDDDGEVIPSKEKHRGTYGKYTRQVADHYSSLLGKNTTAQTMAASKKLLAFIHKKYPDDTNASLAKEAKSAINLAKKYYEGKDLTDWGLLKVIENWDKIL